VWCGWCVNEGYLEAHYTQRASATAPLPGDGGRKPGDQQAWTSEQRHALTRHVDEQAREAVFDAHDIDDEIAPVVWGECKDYSQTDNAAIVVDGNSSRGGCECRRRQLCGCRCRWRGWRRRLLIVSALAGRGGQPI
jgi:hypothetical protein